MNDRATATSITCVRCSQENPGSHEFCRGCGANLYTTCPSCTQRVQVSERFCGSCGKNLEEHREAERKQVQEKLQRIDALREEFLFTDALLLAKALVKLDETKFPGVAEQARKIVAELEEARRLADERVERAMRVAAQLFEHHDYIGAAKTLGELPKVLRGPEGNELLEEAVSKAQRVRTLRERVQEALKAQPVTAFPMLAELVALQPQDEKIQTLGEQIAERLAKGAAAKVDSGAYLEASRMLAQVPEVFCSEKLLAQKRQIDEVVWLERDLKETPLIDEALVACAQRLHDRLGSKQAKAAQWLSEANKRWQEAKTKVDLTLPWSANMGPKFGKGMKWFNPLARFSTETVKVPGGAAQLQRFSVALGLAMQALGKSPIEETLVTNSPKGLARFSLLGKKKPTAGWGLDIGATSVKAAKVTLNGEKLVVESLKIVELNADAVLVQDEAAYREALRGAVAKLKDEIEVKSDPIVASVDSQGCMFRFVSLPSVDEAKFKEMVQLEAKHLIPYAEDQVYWFSHRLATSNTGNREVMIVASRRKEVDDLQAMIEQLGLKISAMQAAPVALLNLNLDLAEDAQSSEVPKLLVELGASHTHVIATWGNQAFVRTIGRGGRRFTQQLARELKLTLAEAERTKLSPLSYESPLSLYRALEQPLAELFLELERSVRAAEQRGLKIAEAQILLSGGASRLHGLPRVLCQGAEGIALADQA